jgi:transposase InsO family protein
MMARFGFGGAEMISAHLALAGFKIAEKSVRNIKKEKVATPVHAPEPPRPPNPVKANFVNHVWMMDVTEFKTIFGARTLYLAACFDAFSRLPLAAMTFERKPGGAAMARLFRKAVRVFQAPRYLVTDLGKEFVARAFQQALSRAGVKPRFASADSIRATARLERFWKTLKQLAGTRLVPPIDIGDLEQRLSAAFVYYCCLRPHTSLGNRTPLQAFLGEASADLSRLPRGRKGETAPPLSTTTTVCAAGFPSLIPAAG